MLAVDTNLLVHVQVDDPTALDQCRAARQAVSEAGEFLVSQAVQIETVWVLVSAYGLSKTSLQHTLGAITNHPAFHLQRREVFQKRRSRIILRQIQTSPTARSLRKAPARATSWRLSIANSAS